MPLTFKSVRCQGDSSGLNEDNIGGRTKKLLVQSEILTQQR